MRATNSSTGYFTSTADSLLWVLDNSGLTLVVLLLVVALNVVVFVKIPKGFFPQQDTGVIFGGLQGPQDASFPCDERFSASDRVGYQKRPRRRQRGGLHRRPGQQQRRLHFHVIQAAECTQSQRHADPGAATAQNAGHAGGLRRSCSPARTCASADGRAMHCTNTPSNPTPRKIWPTGGPFCFAR